MLRIARQVLSIPTVLMFRSLFFLFCLKRVKCYGPPLLSVPNVIPSGNGEVLVAYEGQAEDTDVRSGNVRGSDEPGVQEVLEECVA